MSIDLHPPLATIVRRKLYFPTALIAVCPAILSNCIALFRSLLAVLGFVVLMAGPLHAGIQLRPTWVLLSPATSPSARWSYGMTYDGGHGQVVLFGGDDAEFPPSPLLNDTWTWDGTNWTQHFPSTSPSPRREFSLAYDAAHGKVVLFGGFDANSNTLGDTWTWDGTTWTRQFPAHSPSPRAMYGMDYDGAHGQVVLFGGLVPGASLDTNDTWTWNGTDWTQLSPPASPPARYLPAMSFDALHGNIVLAGGVGFHDTWIWDGNTWTQQFPLDPAESDAGFGMAYDGALGQVVRFGGDPQGGSPASDTWAWNGADWTQQFPANSPSGRDGLTLVYDAAVGQFMQFGGGPIPHYGTWVYQSDFGNLGSAHLCGSRHIMHEVCATSATLNFTISLAKIGSIQYLTEGTPNLDFKESSTPGTCSAHTYSRPVSCTVNVTFVPTEAGERNGAVVFYSPGGSVLATIPLYGLGIGAEAGFSPATQSVLGGGFQAPHGVAVDGSGNVYVADTSNDAVKKIPAGCLTSSCVTTLGGGFYEPYSVAVDGGGNVYVADYGNNAVKQIPVGCTSLTCVMVVGRGFSLPTGIALDGSSIIYVADWGNGAVKSMPSWCESANCVTTLGGGFSKPYGVALDSSRNVYVTDPASTRVSKMPSGCGSAQCVATLYTDFNPPEGIAVDAAGDLYIGESPNNTVFELPVGCTSLECIRPLGTGFDDPAGLALDGADNLYVADFGASTVSAVRQTVPELVSFNATFGGGTSGDSPKTVTVQNIGNAPLAFSTLTFPADFPGAAAPNGGGCAVGAAVEPSESCTIAIDFSPLVTSGYGLLSEDVIVLDNALGESKGTQEIPVSGKKVRRAH